MSQSRPKSYVAATDLHGEFKKGEVVPPGARLQHLLRYGDKFVTEDAPARKGTPTTKDVDPVDDPKENEQ